MKYTLNLATRSYVNRRALYLCYAVLGALLVTFLMLNLLRFFSLQSEISRNDASRTKIEGELLSRSGVDAVGYDETSYKKLITSIQAANAILQQDSFRWTPLLDQLESIVPRAVRIDKISPDHLNKTVKLSGQAKTLQSLKRFIDNLIKSGNYTHVFLEAQSTEQQTGLIRFSITLEGAF
ncbi:MAG: PilN domain-containing protein [Desulfuromonadales bacterium]|nr:PilN domain-containing protein [Desulfuromonadales bacterium]